MTPDPKPRARVRLSPAKYRVLVEVVITMAGGRCECGCGRPAESAHHVVARGQRGDDVLENLIALAGDGTRLCHGALEDAHRTWDPIRRVYVDPQDVRAGIRRRLAFDRRDVLAYVLEAKGQDWLDRRYPPLNLDA